jgi:hypothetical protein
MVGITRGVYSVGLILFLQEQIKDMIIINRMRHISALGMRSSFSSTT